MQRAVKIQLAFNIRIEIANSTETLEMAAYEKAKQD
jgi:hypothetical protein